MMEDEKHMEAMPEDGKRPLPDEEDDEGEAKKQKTESEESSEDDDDDDVDDDESETETERKEENDGDDEAEEETNMELPADLIPPPDLSLEPPTDSPLMPLEAPEDEEPPASEDDDEPYEARKVQNLRKNIKDVLDTAQLDASTLAAQREESERLARVQEQQRIQREQLRQIAMDKHTKAEERVLQLLQGPKPDIEEAKKEVVTIEDSSSDDDCIVVSDEEEPEEEEDDDPQNSGLHTNDSYNIPDDQGRVLVNFGHAEDEPDVFLAPQIAKIIKPHQIGGIRFLFDNIVESVTRYEQSTGFGCILAHSMGLGKTIQVVSFCDVFLRHTTSKTVLIIMPINTLQNWQNEFNMWLPEHSNVPGVRTRHFKVFLLNDNHRTLSARATVVLEWAKVGGVLMIGYEMYRLLSMKKMARNRRKKMTVVEETAEEQKGLFDAIHEALVKPGPDLVICDEGHRIKNSHASVSVALKQIKSRRRVVLTGYPLQNNLIEYWCMVDFVRPNYLGSKSEFSNMFDRPIQNGQCVDSTPKDIQLMRFRAHVLHSLLVGFVQRRSHLVLRQSLPAKQEYVLLVRMTDFQRKVYETFMNEVVRKQNFPNPLKAFAVCCKIWNHPDVLFNFMKKREADLDLELDDETTSTSTASTVTPKKSRPRSKKDAPPPPPPPTTTTAVAAATFAKPEPTYSSNFSAPTPSYSQFPQNFSSSTTNPATYNPAYNQSNSSYPAPPGQGFDGYYQQYPYTYNRYDQYGYYGSQNYPQQTPGFPSQSGYYANQTYQPYTTPSTEYGSSNYYPPYQYPTAAQQQETKQEEKKPKSPEPPKPDAADFVNKLAEEIKDEVEGDKTSEKGGKDDTIPYDWAAELMKGYVPDLLENSPKMQVFFLLLTESIRLGDRILLFSQSLLTLNVIEKFLQRRKIPNTDMYWAKNISYFRLDGSTVAQEREKLINNFNVNPNVHLFLVSTRAGSLGINLVGANRVIVFDASWNPCHDTQAVCRVYRYGQKKPCFVYRIVMDACLEKKIYDRQISKQGMSDRVVDECNPEAHLSMKEVTSFCFDDDDVTEVRDFSDTKEEYTDSVLKLLLEQFSQQLTKKPFQHESLLVDKKEKKLSASEKRMARRGYELEKMNTTKPAYSYTSMGTTYRAYRTADGTLVHKAVQPQIRPFNTTTTTTTSTTTTTDQTASGGRASAWIPADIWQKQGMSAQEMTLPSDVVIPTSSADKENIVLKAGQRVMVLKSHRGIYMQLESGKIIAIRTTVKPENGAKKSTDQPSTSGGTSKTDTKTDTDDDDIIMTSITYPEAKPGVNNASPRLQVPTPAVNATAAAAASSAGTTNAMYMNGGVPKRPRGRPPTYNGYHPAYIPPGAVPQPLQAYSRAKDYVPAPFGKISRDPSYPVQQQQYPTNFPLDKSKVIATKDNNYIPQSVLEKSVQQPQQPHQLPIPKISASSEMPYANHAPQLGQYGGYHQPQPQQYSRPFENNLPTAAPAQPTLQPPPPYIAAQTPQQPPHTNGGVRQWQ